VTLVATLLRQHEAFHRAVLAAKLVSRVPLILERSRSRIYTQQFACLGLFLLDAQHEALALLDSILTQQLAVLSFADTFLGCGCVGSWTVCRCSRR
jgi:hypothetical protein